MTDDALARTRCIASCYVPPVPHQMVGVLLRYHRIQAGLSCLRAGQLTEISRRWLQDLELARKPMPDQTVRTLLHTYGTPEEHVQSTIALLPPPESEHRHQIGVEALPRNVWVPALKTSAQEVTILSTGPLQAAVDLATPVPPVPGPAQRYCRTVLLLHTDLLNRAPAERLAPLVRLVESKALTVRLVSSEFTAPIGLWSEWTLAASNSDRTATQRRRHQLYVTHAPEKAPVVRNGHTATADQELIQEALRCALPTPANAHQLRQALQRPGFWGASDERRSPATAVHASAARRPA